MNREIYSFMNHQSSWLIWWIMAFTVINLSKIGLRFLRREPSEIQNTFFVEAAGFPLVILHSVCFVKAFLSGDFYSLLLFAWWGPGFLIVAALYINKMKEGEHLKWGKSRNIIAWICKLNYLVFAVIYWHLGCLNILFVFSIWIMNDQVMMLWLSDDADRTRRCIHDHWFIRILYPSGLFMPILFPGYFHHFYLWGIYGALLFFLWFSGVTRLLKRGNFMELPKDQGLLRNMTYFKDQELQNDQCN